MCGQISTTQIVLPESSHHIWNVDVDAVCLFKACLDKFWMHQDVMYDFAADLTGIGDRSISEISWLYLNQKNPPYTTFVDITAMHVNFCTKFYTIVKRSNIHFITKFYWNISGIDKATQF